MGFEPAIAAGERPKSALEREATGGRQNSSFTQDKWKLPHMPLQWRSRAQWFNAGSGPTYAVFPYICGPQTCCVHSRIDLKTLWVLRINKAPDFWMILNNTMERIRKEPVVIQGKVIAVQ